MTASENVFTVLDSIDLSFDDTPISLENRPEIVRQSAVGFDAEKLVPTQTYVQCGLEKLTALCNAAGLNHKIEQIAEIFLTLTSSWGETVVGADTTWKSDVSDDCSPFEFSIALDPNKAELRVLVEAQGSDPNLQSNWQAGLELNQQLAAKYNVSLDRFEQIADLFAPTNSEAKFSIWHSACFYLDKDPAFKLYVNPQSQSKSKAAAIVEESLVRLGFDRAWPTLAETAAQRGPDKDEFIYFSLDLAAHAQARVKVYLRHHDATPAELESALSAANNYVAGDAIEFCQAMAPGQTSFAQKPAITCFSFIEEDNSVPSSGTLYLPISNYASDDQVVCDKINLYFIQHGFPVSVYQSVLKSFANRKLEAGIGMHSYISLRQDRQEKRIAIYLNPEANSVIPSKIMGIIQLNKKLSSLQEVVSHYQEFPLHIHPLFQRLQRESVNKEYLWLLLINIGDSATNFTRRLSYLISRIDDRRICSILAKQLNDELGNGNIDHIHVKLYERLMSAVNPWGIQSFNENMLIHMQEFSQRLEEIYTDSNPYIGLGAAIAFEFYGEQFNPWLGRELRRTNIDPSDMIWVTLHEKLEVDHADESLVIVRFISESEENVAAAIQGMERVSMVLWRLCNGLYQLCYG